MNKLVFATQNPGKLEEIREILAGLDVEVVSAVDAGFAEDVVEDRDTFVGNALKKAHETALATGEWSVADDSGICIDALDGQPGVFTARWAGEGASDEELVCYTLKQMKDVPEGKRQASFHSVAALVSPEGDKHVFEGVIEGEVLTEPIGSHKPRLPYDVIFKPTGHNKAFSQMEENEKNSLSHRGIAFGKLKTFIQENL